ncbi:MAG: NIL domain-containing protein [Acidimicrobiales bacterium]
MTVRPSRLRLTFPGELVKQPIVAQLVRRFDVTPNIRRASVDETVGWIICELGGEPEAVEEAIVWLHDLGVEVDQLGDVVES